MFSAASKTGSQPSAAFNYVEDVFSTYLYTGNGTSQTINNGIDLSGKGGLVWLKDRGANDWGNSLFDTVRGAGNRLKSNSTAAQSTGFDQTFTSSGFTLDGNANYNWNGDSFVSWTFRKQPKFFDIVTWSGNDTAGRTISHSLGSVPGLIIVKATSRTSGWTVYHRSTGATQYLNLNTTAAAGTTNIYWNDTAPTSTVFTVGNSAAVNGSGETYIAYVFAHDAGGFGLTGTDNIITCGSIAVDSNGNGSANLGYEPQLVLAKNTTNAQNWLLFDTMRGFPNAFANGPDAVRLSPNTSGPEAGFGQVGPTATGWGTNAGQLNASSTYIYMAIRRGPMKVPTDATTVFKPVVQGFDGFVNTGFVTDLIFGNQYTGGNNWRWVDRLRNQNRTLFSNLTSSEGIEPYWQLDYNTGVNLNYGGTIPNWVWSNFRRAPGFFDTVCYTGNNTSPNNLNHNLGVIPELIIIKCRDSTTDGNSTWGAGWWTAVKGSGANGYWFLPSNGGLNSTNASAYSDTWSSYFNSATTFDPGQVSLATGNQGIAGNVSGKNYVAYLFSTCSGVSKVGSYTGNGTTQAISCGFTGGARFVLIKRTDSTGGWYVYNTARGMTTLTDPYLFINSDAAESATLGSVTSTAGGFSLNSAILAAINVSGGTYIFLAIA
jgi:hypothetical protein